MSFGVKYISSRTSHIRFCSVYQRKRVTEYLTKWKGYEEKHNSWEVEEHFAAGCNVLACYKKVSFNNRRCKSLSLSMKYASTD